MYYTEKPTGAVLVMWGGHVVHVACHVWLCWRLSVVLRLVDKKLGFLHIYLDIVLLK